MEFFAPGCHTSQELCLTLDHIDMAVHDEGGLITAGLIKVCMASSLLIELVRGIRMLSRTTNGSVSVCVHSGDGFKKASGLQLWPNHTKAWKCSSIHYAWHCRQIGRAQQGPPTLLLPAPPTVPTEAAAIPPAPVPETQPGNSTFAKHILMPISLPPTSGRSC